RGEAPLGGRQVSLEASGRVHGAEEARLSLRRELAHELEHDERRARAGDLASRRVDAPEDSIEALAVVERGARDVRGALGPYARFGHESPGRDRLARVHLAREHDRLPRAGERDEALFDGPERRILRDPLLLELLSR